MKTIVLIENDAEILDDLQQAFSQWHEFVEVLTANDGASALFLMSEHQVDLVICEIALSDMKEMEILSVLAEHFTDVPCIALAVAGSDREDESRDLGAGFYLEKPLRLDLLMEQAADLVHIDFGGQVHGIPVASFLQMLEGEDKSCTLRIQNEEKTGFLYLQAGVLIDAASGHLQGEDAVYEIVTWNHPVIDIKYFNPKKKDVLQKPLMSLLLEAFKIKDEQENKEQTTGIFSNTTELQQMSTDGHRISLDMGARLGMDVKGLDMILSSIMVGMIPDSLIIATMPSQLDSTGYHFEDDCKIEIKYLHMGKLCRFSCHLLAVSEKPQKMLFLSYPKVVYYHELRKVPRAMIYIPCTLSDKANEERKGALVDLSISGGLCHVKSTEKATVSDLHIDDKLILRCMLPGMKKEFEIPIVIRNFRKSRQEEKIGVEFSEVPLPVREAIETYIASIQKVA